MHALISYSVTRRVPQVSEIISEISEDDALPDDAAVLERAQRALKEIAGGRGVHESKEQMWRRVARAVGIADGRVRDFVYGETVPKAAEFLRIEIVRQRLKSRWQRYQPPFPS